MRIRVRHAVTPAQKAFLEDPAPFRAFVGGVGSGKSRAGALAMLQMPPCSIGMVVSATYRHLKDNTLPPTLTICRTFISRFNKQDFEIELENGTTILFRSADNPDSLRGPNIGWFWLDEAALVDEEVWDIMIGRLRLPPMRAWITTTPKGQNWVYRLFVKSGDPDYSLHRCRTEENIFVPPVFAERLRKKYSSAFARQELDGEFISLEGARVPREWIRYGDAQSFVRTSIGVDLAISRKQEADYTAVVVTSRDEEGRIWVRHARRDRLSFHNILRMIVDTCNRYHPHVVYVEANQFQAAVVQELLRTTSLPVVAMQADHDKMLRFQIAEARYEQGLIYHSPSLPPEFEDEITSFPNGEHDDFCDALVYAIAALGGDIGDISDALVDAAYRHTVL